MDLNENVSVEIFVDMSHEKNGITRLFVSVLSVEEFEEFQTNILPSFSSVCSQSSNVS